MLIRVVEDYEIYVDNNKDYEARFDTHKTMITKDKDGTEKETKVYKTIGHYSNVVSACKKIYEDMCIRKGEKKDFITLKEWIDIQKEMLDVINNAMERLEV